MLHRYHQSAKLPGYNLCAQSNHNSGDPGGNGSHLLARAALVPLHCTMSQSPPPHHAISSPAVDLISMVFEIPHPKSPGVDMHNRERPCLEHVQRCPGLLVAFSLSLVSFKTGGHKPETMFRTSAAQAMGTFTPAAQVLSWSFGQLRTPENPG